MEPTFVQDVKNGDVVRDPIFFSYNRITSIARQDTGDTWPLYTYMGLTADAAQWVCVPVWGWVRISDVGHPALATCPAIYSLTIDTGRVIDVSGIACCANDTHISSLHSPFSPLVSPSSSPSLSDDESLWL